MAMFQFVRRFSRLSLRFEGIKYTPGFNSLSTESTDLNKKVQPIKKPVSAYALYISHNLKDSHGVVTTKLAKLAEQWKNLPEENKKEFNEKAAKEKEAYFQNISKLTEEEKNQLKENERLRREKLSKFRSARILRKKQEEHNKPIRPAPATYLWYKENSQTLNFKGKELVAKIGKSFAELPMEEKKKYIEQYQKQYEEYNKQLQAWNAKMLIEGDPDIVSESFKSKVKKNLIKEVIETKKAKAKKDD